MTATGPILVPVCKTELEKILELMIFVTHMHNFGITPNALLKRDIEYYQLGYD